MRNVVELDINTYNTLKSDAVRANMIVDHLFRTACISEKACNEFTWDNKKLSEVLEIAYPRRYANKIDEELGMKCAQVSVNEED